jgi:prepilin peptidase CpaA
MNMVILEYGLLAGLATLLLIAAITDWRSRLINNWLTGTIAITAPLYWWATGLGLWPDVAIQIGIAVVIFAIFAAFFALGAMGGGDVKLLGALALCQSLAASSRSSCLPFTSGSARLENLKFPMALRSRSRGFG